MKILILPFLLILTLVFSCRSEDYALLEKKVASYDVYVGGTEDLQVCYWKNNQKTILPGGDNLLGIQIEVDNNDIYVLATNIEQIDQVRAWYFWKNGIKHNVAQYLNVAPNTSNAPENLSLIRKMIVKNGDIYFAGTMKNPNPTSSLDQFEICYWKNGVKTVVSNYSNESIGGFELFNNDVYIATRKNMNFTTMSWDVVNYKNGAMISSTNTSGIPGDYFKNSSEIFLLEKYYTQYNSIITQSYRNIFTTTVINFPTNIIPTSINYIYWDENDKYYVGKDFYYKNNTLIQINDPNGFNIIGQLSTKDQNIYMTRSKNSSVKFYINNVETMILTDTSKGCFNSIFVVQN